MSAAMVRTRDDPCLALTDAPRETRARRWDFCALPQHDPVSGAKRSEAENGVFKAGLAVMSNAYASPRVLVLQHRRIPPELAAEVDPRGVGAALMAVCRRLVASRSSVATASSAPHACRCSRHCRLV